MASRQTKRADIAEANEGKGMVMLLRHAQAAWPKPDVRDFDRALSDQGHKEANAIAGQLLALNIVPDRIVCSPAVRCRETLEPIIALFKESPTCEFDPQLYHGGLPSYVDMITEQDPSQAVLIIGHNPMIEDVFAWMANGQEGDFLGYPTAGLAVFSHDPKSETTRNWKLEGLYLP